MQAAELAQSVERTTLNRVVGGSIPPFGVYFFIVVAFLIEFYRMVFIELKTIFNLPSKVVISSL